MKLGYVFLLGVFLMGFRCKNESADNATKSIEEPEEIKEEAVPGEISKDSADDDKKSPPPSSPGGLMIQGCDDRNQCADAVSSAITASSNNIGAISNARSPGSLAITESGLVDTQPDISGCFSQHGPGPCQKTAVQFYIWMANQPIEAMKEVLSGIAPALKQHMNSATGKIEDPDGGPTIEYLVRSTTDFEVIVHMENNEKAYLYHKDASTYELKYYAPNDEVTSGNIIQYVKADIIFKHDDEWTSHIYTMDSACSGEGTPPLAVKTSKKDGVWRGKAMVYQYLDTENCEINVNGDSGYYTDFIGDDSFTTGSMYWFPVGAKPAELTAEQLQSYTLNDICTHVPLHESATHLCDGWSSYPELTDHNTQSWLSCDSGSSYYSNTYDTACSDCQSSGYSDSGSCGQIPTFRWFYMQHYYPNPYCIAPSTDVLEAQKKDDPSSGDFGSACSDANNADIVSASYSPASEWINPNILRNLGYETFFCFPKSIIEIDQCL